VDVQNNAGCWNYSGIIEINVGQIFYIELNYNGPKDMIICTGDSLFLKPLDEYASYKWNTGSTEESIYISKAGIYWLEVTDEFGFKGYSDTLIVSEFPKPSKPGIKKTGQILQCTLIEKSYQWYLNENKIEGAVFRSITVQGDGDYRVEVFDVRGCSNTSDVLRISEVIDVSRSGVFDVRAVQGGERLMIKLNSGGIYDNFGVKVINVLGEVLLNLSSQTSEADVDISNLFSGIYFLMLEYGNDIYFKKFIK